ncbi:MAG: SET domain-containing protein [Chitinophagales bacterium]|nr:SET domain-containing protein [Chitinophagales bacterium]
MKARLLPIVAIFCLSAIGIAKGQNPIPKYELNFSYTDAGNVTRDTMLTRFGYKLWSGGTNYPGYTDWLNYPFAVANSIIAGVGLFTDSSSSFTSGQSVGYAFYKTGSTGKFSFDYVETNLGSFINDSQTPNLDILVTSDGIVLRANQAIGPNTELTANYRALIALFPQDASLKALVRYW